MPPPPPPAHTLTAKRRISTWTWTAVIAVPLILAASFGSYFILAAPIPDHPPAANESGQGPQEAVNQDVAAELEITRLRAEARRNALATGAGFVAIAALILALRRQQHLERSTAVAENDALQRRITDARIQAVEQLGSENPAVRIGGLHNLERIGQQHTELRQVVLDEICSYLRLPYTPPVAAGAREPLPAHQFEPIGPPLLEVENAEAEYEVRLIAQEILQRHLKPDSEHLYWVHSRLNLRNAHLHGIDFRTCNIIWADFTTASFGGDAYFEDAIFTGDASFRGATFTKVAYFERVTFTQDAYLEHATFGRNANFIGATFNCSLNFRGATFAGIADFPRATFAGDADFGGVTFMSDAVFGGAVFSDYTTFMGVNFSSEADFGGVTFSIN